MLLSPIQGEAMSEDDFISVYPEMIAIA
jgi:hypothetical protein